MIRMGHTNEEKFVRRQAGEMKPENLLLVKS